jgi:hypothetical protein
MTTFSRRRVLLGAVVLLAAAAAPTAVRAEPGGNELVAFNTKSHKYHCPECEWAIKCTRNCVLVSRDAAQARGGVPCKICGGACRRATAPSSDNAPSFPPTFADPDDRALAAGSLHREHGTSQP